MSDPDVQAAPAAAGVMAYGTVRPAGDGEWLVWETNDPTLYNAHVLGPLLIRREGSQLRVRMETRPHHANLLGVVHGGATLGLIDVAMFAILTAQGRDDSAGAVTLELSTQFIGPGRLDRPLDVVGEVTHETGRMAFVRGVTEQAGDDGTTVRTGAFQGTLRKASRHG